MATDWTEEEIPLLKLEDGIPAYTIDKLNKLSFVQGDWDSGDVAWYRFTTPIGKIEGYYVSSSLMNFKNGKDAKVYTFWDGRVVDATPENALYITEKMLSENGAFHVTDDCTAKKMKKIENEKIYKGYDKLFPSQRKCYGVIQSNDDNLDPPLVIITPIERMLTRKEITARSVLQQGLRGKSNLSSLNQDIASHIASFYHPDSGGRSRRKKQRKGKKRRKTRRRSFSGKTL